MSIKAYKLTTQELKMICDFFALDRGGRNTKDSLVELVLDFLEEPNDELCKQPPKKREKPSSSSKKGGEDSTSSSSSPSKRIKLNYTKGTMPSDAAIKTWVHAFAICHDMDQTTIKDAMKVANEKFGIDLKEKKSLIKECFAEETSAE